MAGGRPKKNPENKKTSVYPLRMREDFHQRLKDFSEMTGKPVADILREGAMKLINEWHRKEQEKRDQEQEKVFHAYQ